MNTSFIVVLTLTAFYLLNFFGYALTTIFWMFGVGYFAGEKSVKKLLVFSLVVVFIGYIIFWQILSVQLPLGSFEKYLVYDSDLKLFTIILLVLITVLIYILISLITKTLKYSDIKLKY